MFRAIVAAFWVFLWVQTAAAASNWPPSAPDLSVTIAPEMLACLEATDCRLLVRIENLGSADYAGPLGFIISTSVPAVPGPSDKSLWTCESQTYGRMSCATSGIGLAPGGTTDLLVTIRMLPTPLGETSICANLDWNSDTLGARNQLYNNLAASFGQQPADQPADPQHLRALFGDWGEGDLRAANDKDCTKIAIKPAVPGACAINTQAVNGSCVSLATLCTGGRSWDQAKAQCSCPAGRPAFDPATRSCGATVSVQCEPGRTANNGLCICPASAPQWNAATGKCEAFKLPEVKVVKAEPTPPPAVTKTVNTPTKAKHVRAKKHRAHRICFKGRILHHGRCVRIRDYHKHKHRR